MRANTAYSVPLPVVQNNSFSFKFNVTAPDGTHKFVFFWNWYNPEGGIQNSWYFQDTMPNGVIRSGRVSANAIQWSQSNDVGILFQTSLDTIGQNDLSKVSMYILYWS